MKRRNFLITAVPAATELAVLPASVTSAAAAVPRAQVRDGGIVAPYGMPSSFESHVVRRPPGVPSPAFTPLAAQLGTITPSGLTFVRNHAGTPLLDPRTHRLLVHGNVQRALTFSLTDLLRFPAVERPHFIECAGNSAAGWQQFGSGVQFSHGLVSSCWWTGVRLKDVLDEAGMTREHGWFVAEGADDAKFDRSFPLDAVLDDALIVYGQNGEMLRPEQGYPLRLLLPGFEGSTSVKWLRRIKLTNGPVYSREETSQYSDELPNGHVRVFDFVMDVKSVITSPSPGLRLEGPGPYELRGFAWSGRGRITGVDLSLDGGQTWQAATLDDARSSKAFTRFGFGWRWDGTPCTIASRARDETGAVQPSLSELVARRGPSPRYHVNAIARWSIARDGSVANADA